MAMVNLIKEVLFILFTLMPEDISFNTKMN